MAEDRERLEGMREDGDVYIYETEFEYPYLKRINKFKKKNGQVFEFVDKKNIEIKIYGI